HRIATAFIGGAGLLLLIPVFFRDVVEGILTLFLAAAGNNFQTLPYLPGIGLSLVMYALLLYPLLLSLIIPLYGVYLLLKDIIHFYFTIYMPGFPDNLLNPTFSLHGLAFPTDESTRVKGEVMRYQYQKDNMHFMMAFSEGKRQEYFDTIIENTNGEILPDSRRMERLIAEGWLPDNYDPKEVNRFNAALGIARSLDRTLVEEVAVQEMSLVRAVTYLRRLVLRYVKTLMMFIWTTTVSFLMLPFLHDDRFPIFLVLAFGYVVWSLLVMQLIRQPLRWLYRHRLGDVNEDHIDAQLGQMENYVAFYCRLAVVSSFAGLGLVLLSLVV
ncbi:MAG TPA: hypothetical protein VHL11_20030, partial [Phototrophicaceae bacterium]|nr:hypothetical protein [Phototrophicaceae bacterium]